MKLKTTLLASAALVLSTGVTFADGHMADELTVVSWGGAYQKSQQRAYSEPYAADTGVNFIWDESSSEAVAKLRAMKTDDNRLLLKTNMEAGHGGASGRYKRYEEIAFQYAFMLDLLAIAE